MLNFLITAGPTREPIDPVRYLSNRSSGKMGYAIADAAAQSGHQVVLISGPVSIDLPPKVDGIRINTAEEMYEEVYKHINWADVFVMSAAVADFRPAHFQTQKMKKHGKENLQLELVATRDILLSLRDYKVEQTLSKELLSSNQNSIGTTTHYNKSGLKPRPYMVGFAAETENMAQAAKKKLIEKNCDILIANDVSRSDIGFESDCNEVTIYFQNGNLLTLPRTTKSKLAIQMVEIFTNIKKRD